MESYREAFPQGARGRGIPMRRRRMSSIRIAAFAGYGSCKAHSASFALEARSRAPGGRRTTRQSVPWRRSLSTVGDNDRLPRSTSRKRGRTGTGTGSAMRQQEPRASSRLLADAGKGADLGDQ